MQKLLKYKSWLLITIFISLFMLDNLSGCIVGSLTLLFIIIFEKTIRKMFTKPGFLAFIIIVMAVPVLWNFSLENILYNLLILIRGIILIAIIFIAGKDISSTKFYNNIQEKLPEELIDVIKISSSILPAMLANIEKEFKSTKISKISFCKSFINLFEIMINTAEDLTLKLKNNSNKNIIIITGKKHEGKSSLALKLAKFARKNNYKVKGIISISENENQKRCGYKALDLETNKVTPLATTKEINNYKEKCGPFFFYKEGFEFTSKILDNNFFENNEIIFIDEVGKLELKEEGFYKQINNALLSEKQLAIVLVIRDEYINLIEEKFNVKATNIIKVAEKNYQSSKETFISAISS
ncbi:MAG: nucleoside-triphosphatase [Vampirovibrionia bacterium]